jgi:hypothetical protein
MNIHKNARTMPHSRLLMIRRVLDEKQPRKKVVAEFGVGVRTVGKWGGALAGGRRAEPP